MARITQISPESATGRAKELLDEVKGKLGLVPNMTRAMANAPVVLDGYLQLSGVLGKGTLPARAREQIALAVAQANDCDYCLAAHSTVGRMVGLTAEQISDSRLGTSVDPRTDALIRFALKVLESRGAVGDGDLRDVREAGFDEGAIAEVVANVALHIFTNYFNRMAATDIDFPKAPALRPEPAPAN
ncbi:carboxymuconolactone decarboxylase family protein [Tundrisphaera lichenicola]|uniref:carboxymuconolactone decarboxylase family protein n=1 Tax=Tundrisphaera lichenicola TaxID=2029860 RepID=UPI003EBB5A6D